MVQLQELKLVFGWTELDETNGWNNGQKDVDVQIVTLVSLLCEQALLSEQGRYLPESK